MPDGNIRTRRQRLEEREESIVAAAHEEFVEKGFAGARVAGIARRAGLAEGTLYLYFKNKGALLEAVVAAFYERLTESAAEGVKLRAATEDRLTFLARHHLASCLTEWSILTLAMPVLYQTGSYRGSGYFALNRTYVSVFDNVIREGIARGDVRDDLPLHMMRDLFYGTLEHAVRTIMVREPPARQDNDADVIADQVMAMVRPAYGLIDVRSSSVAATPLEHIAQRLETAVSRLEAAAT